MGTPSQLSVNTPFSFGGTSYSRGDRITDPATITAIEASAYVGYVVPVGGPAPVVVVAGVPTIATGADHSANPAAIPSGTPLITIPINPNRQYVEVDNQSGASIQVVRDNGNGANVSSVILAPGAGAGAQGGAWSSATFKGRVQVFAPAGSQIAAFED